MKKVKNIQKGLFIMNEDYQPNKHKMQYTIYNMYRPKYTVCIK